MTFSQFLLYYLGAHFIYQAIMISVLYARHKYVQHALKKAIASGKIRVVTMDELAEQMKNNGDGNRWN